MATVPVKISLASIQDVYLYCTHHDNYIKYESVAEAKTPLDTSNCTCPGVEKEIDQIELQFASWRSKLGPVVVASKTHDETVDEAMMACQSSWQLIVNLEDATVTVA